jgi:hypothetical protein
MIKNIFLKKDETIIFFIITNQSNNEKLSISNIIPDGISNSDSESWYHHKDKYI